MVKMGLGNIAFLVGLISAVVIALFGDIIGFLGLVVILAGAIVGFINIAVKESTGFDHSQDSLLNSRTQ